jgi:hypothetical protein
MTFQYPHWFGMIFLIGSISIITYMFIIRSMISMRVKKWNYLRIDFNESLGGLIADEIHLKSLNFNSSLRLQLAELRRKTTGSAMASQIMVDQIMMLRQNLSGRAPSLLDEIYTLLELHHFSLKKLSSPRSKIKAQGIRELTNVGYQQAVSEVEGSKRADNKMFMIKTLMALSRKGEKDLSFIDSYRGELTHWMQLTIYNHLLEVDPAAIPAFSCWFNSSNSSVALFAIRMSGVFRQRTSIPDLKALLRHPQVAIVEAAEAALDLMR